MCLLWLNVVIHVSSPRQHKSEKPKWLPFLQLDVLFSKLWFVEFFCCFEGTAFLILLDLIFLLERKSDYLTFSCWVCTGFSPRQVGSTGTCRVQKFSKKMKKVFWFFLFRCGSQGWNQLADKEERNLQNAVEQMKSFEMHSLEKWGATKDSSDWNRKREKSWKVQLMR